MQLNEWINRSRDRLFSASRALKTALIKPSEWLSRAQVVWPLTFPCQATNAVYVYLDRNVHLSGQNFIVRNYSSGWNVCFVGFGIDRLQTTAKE